MSQTGEIPQPAGSEVSLTSIAPTSASFGVENLMVMFTEPPAATVGLAMACEAEMLFTNPPETGVKRRPIAPHITKMIIHFFIRDPLMLLIRLSVCPRNSLS
jgi:hypothetical protein